LGPSEETSEHRVLRALRGAGRGILLSNGVKQVALTMNVPDVQNSLSKCYEYLGETRSNAPLSARCPGIIVVRVGLVTA
jgi:hypothetical protein